MYIQRSHYFVIYTPLMMAQNRAERTRVTISYGSFINQFLPDTIKSMWQLERTYTKICKQNISILFNEICINEEMLPPPYIYIYIYIYIYVWTGGQQTGTINMVANTQKGNSNDDAPTDCYLCHIYWPNE